MQFEMLKEKSSIIKVIGVGGGGGNAVNHMYRQGITGVDFIICNTDAQALELSPIPNKVQLGASLTEGMGAGSIPEVGKNSAIENIDDVKEMLGANTRMLFITAGMGGGTGTGASPIIAKAAKELDILTVAIVTTPFSFEGKRRRMQAEEGLEELKKYVDSYLVISNDRLREIFGNLTLGSAFGQADDILTTAAKGIAEIITVPGYINVDFKDVRTVMKDSGVAIMGSYAAEGENRALKAVEGALLSPLLKDNEIEGARYILLNISSGDKEVTMDEVSIITDFIQDQAGLSADLIWGNCNDASLGDKISVTIIATGFQTREERVQTQQSAPKKQFLTSDTPLIRPVNEFVQAKPQAEIPQVTPEVAKPKESIVPQADLFGGMFTQQDQIPVNKEVETIRHQLIEDEPEQVEAKEEENAFEFNLKIEEPTYNFSVPQTNKVQDSFKEEEPKQVIPEPVQQVDDYKTDDSIEEQLRKSKERILRLKDLSMKLRSTSGLQELENEPAYKRKQMQLKDVPHSSESQVSRFTLSNEDGQTEIRPNNSFLHDNVD
ncbi:cell division protein FtsZ [Pedobacter glucosidilyticus]|uniref:cell division protein FtsZ n=1 Tax=Pedobacter glucosidilyticus TaxID=1122941 RepID=UPI0026EC2278|nr:cell division protein FtsZ [Pedobacter glucosidilyticus]